MNTTTNEQIKIQTSDDVVASIPKKVVSVVIPAYNSALFISETIDSVLSQTFNDYEIIVVNDGSPDTEELEKVLESYEKKIIYLKQENRGPSAARNLGIRKSCGEYVAFLDSDDIWMPEFLEEQTGFLKSQPQFDIVYADAHLFGDSQVAGKRFMQVNPSVGDVTLESLLALRCNVITSGVVAKKEKLLNVGLFDEEHGTRSEDFDLWVRLAKDGVRIAYQNKPLLRYRYRKDSLSFDKSKLHDGALKVLEKVEARGELSGEELAALKKTRRMLKASKHIEEGKKLLSNSEYESATKSFLLAKENEKSWKLNLVIFGLRLMPNATRKIYSLMQN